VVSVLLVLHDYHCNDMEFIANTMGRPRDKDLKKVGSFELANIDQGLDSFLLRGFTSALQRSENELKILTALARRELFNPRHHMNVKFVIVHGRKPATSTTS
jgi:hypothetical protein